MEYIEKQVYRVQMDKELLGTKEPWQFYEWLTTRYLEFCRVNNRNRIGFDIDFIGSRFYLDIVIYEARKDRGKPYFYTHELTDTDKEIITSMFEAINTPVNLSKVMYLEYCNLLSSIYDYYAQERYKKLER